jgi:predicted nucleic acid-binding protein
MFLLDTSSLARIHRDPSMKAQWRPKSQAGVLGVCAVTELELLVSARSLDDRKRIQRLVETTYTWVVMPDRVFDRARQVQEMLTEKGRHRGPGATDLLVAATAELTGRTLLHYDHDFEPVARATGQETLWLAPPGSID